MFRRLTLAIGAAVALLFQPVMAQEADETMPDFTGLAAMFEVEPLTAEQEARLPLAQQIIERTIPEGTMREMMLPMYDKILNPMMAMEMEKQSSSDFVAGKLGLLGDELEITETQAAEIEALFDPARHERQSRAAGLIPELIGEMMSLMEPGMKKAMSELYAINFNQQELSEINTFFATDAGTSFARKSFSMASDPRIMSASMEILPQMMGMFVSLEEKMKAATADLPAEREFSELTASERARVAALTGYDESDLDEWSAPAMDVEADAMEAEAMEE